MEIKASVTVKCELGELPKYYKSQRPKGGGFSEVKKLIEIIMSPLILYKYKNQSNTQSEVNEEYQAAL